ncbi:Uncharacterised protein [Halioglobus japonicus]|nr:Uncharacterised protein [Halioglobus japonicus]
MNRRGVRRSAGESMPRAGSDCCAPGEEPEHSKSGTQEVVPTTIEISDDDYRTVHLPCDTLEESGNSEPGH